MFPVYVVEDHNDVLPCIHRLMGSKRIPFDHLVLVHFDSHSDLSVPLRLDANQIFNKEHLYSMTSIENWIIPLMFAGHVDTVIWIKPFWTAHSMKPSSTFHVGEIIANNKIGVTSRDNYFISELSYAPKDVLINTKSVDVHVVNLGSDKICDCGSLPQNYNDISTEVQQGTPSSHNNASQQSIHASKTDGTGVQTVSFSLPSEQPPQKRVRHSRHGLNNAVDVADVRCLNATTELGVVVRSKDATTEHGVDVRDVDATTERGVVDVRDVDAISERGVYVRDVDAITELGIAKIAAADDDKDVEEAAVLINEVLKTTTGTTSFILDIDLDYFSTTDPFLSMFTDHQRQLMSELYRFTPPVDVSNESIMTCVQHRQDQINYLHKIMSSMQIGVVPSLSDSNRDRLVGELLVSIMELSTSSSEVIECNPSFDYEWLHEIGTGIDDCPLPHHISNDNEIKRLVNRVQDLLTSMPRPCAVTVARSSSDSYCPPHQVDSIQSAVLTMLENVYGQLNINMQYLL